MDKLLSSWSNDQDGFNVDGAVLGTFVAVGGAWAGNGDGLQTCALAAEAISADDGGEMGLEVGVGPGLRALRKSYVKGSGHDPGAEPKFKLPGAESVSGGAM